MTEDTFDLRRQLRTIMTLDPSAPALQFAGRWFTWSDLSGAAGRIDELLNAAGIGTGSAVGIVLRNCPEAVAALLAVISTGRAVLSLSPIQPRAALRADVEALRPPVKKWRETCRLVEQPTSFCSGSVGTQEDWLVSKR